MSKRPFSSTRRRVLLGALSVLISGCLYRGPDSPGKSRANLAWSEEALPKLIGDHEAAARIGREYLAMFAEQPSADSLLIAIEAALREQDAGASLVDSGRVAHVIKKKVAMEYMRGEVVSVAGWILSVTEARLYGLAAIGMP